MSKRRRRAAPATKAEALMEVTQIERRVRNLARQLTRSERRGDDAILERALREWRDGAATTAPAPIERVRGAE